jgi:hypothetical protein
MSVLHVLRRLLIALVAYVLALVAGLIAVAVIYGVLSNLPGAPSYFSTMSISPLFMLLLPPVGLLVFYVAVLLTCLPSLTMALIAELFSLRHAWLFALVGAVVGGGAFLYATPLFIGAIDGSDWADLAIVAAGGLIGGVIYWLIAGRRAGFVRPVASEGKWAAEAPASVPSSE